MHLRTSVCGGPMSISTLSKLSWRSRLGRPRQVCDLRIPRNSSEQTIHRLPGITLEALRGHRVKQAEERLALGPAYDDHDLVCPPTGRSALGTRYVIQLVRGLLPTVGHTTISLSRLHSHATHLLRAGVHPKIVSERMGHSAVGITLTRTLMCCQACSKTPFGWWMLPWPRQ